MADDGSLAAQYSAASEQMARLHDGSALRDAAYEVGGRLPAGRAVLLSTSPEGAAIAAVCAAARRAPTSWQLIHLAYPPALEGGQQIVVLEPVDPGAAWTVAVRRHYPDALVLFAEIATECASTRMAA